MGNSVVESRPVESRKAVVQRYVDILTDAGLKAVFGDQRNKDVLIDLLNVILPPHRMVADISYETTEIPGFTLFNKSVRFDLRCRGEDGRQFIVELQCYHQANFFRRCVLYASKAYDMGSQRGDGQVYDIPPVYFIGLLDKDLQDFQKHSPEDSVIAEYTFREKTTMKVPDETIFCIFVELNRFDKELEECGTLLEQWCFALKHISTLDRLPEELRTEAFERLFQACEISRFEPEVKLNYEKEMITERDYYNMLNTAKADGLAEGREEGLAEGEAKGEAKGREEGRVEGRNEEKIRIAKALKENGVADNIIAATTGLSENEIAML